MPKVQEGPRSLDDVREVLDKLVPVLRSLGITAISVDGTDLVFHWDDDTRAHFVQEFYVPGYLHSRVYLFHPGDDGRVDVGRLFPLEVDGRE